MTWDTKPGWKRSPVGTEWKRTIRGKDGKISALLDVQKHGREYYWQTVLAAGGTRGGKTATLADAKAAAVKAAGNA